MSRALLAPVSIGIAVGAALMVGLATLAVRLGFGRDYKDRPIPSEERDKATPAR